MVVKLVREIMVAAKLGGADPDLNARLFVAVENGQEIFRHQGTPSSAPSKKVRVSRTKKWFTETVVYEGYAPHKVPVVVECLTDNRTRTAPEIRNLFKAGSMGQPGSVAFFFNHLGVVLRLPTRTRTATRRPMRLRPVQNEIEPLEAEEVPAGQKGRTLSNYH